MAMFKTLAFTVFLLGQGGDATTTTIAALHPQHYAESNPFLPRDVRRAAGIKIGVVAGQTFVLQRIAKKHPKKAKIVAYSLGAIGLATTALNVRTLRR